MQTGHGFYLQYEEEQELFQHGLINPRTDVDDTAMAGGVGVFYDPFSAKIFEVF